MKSKFTSTVAGASIIITVFTLLGRGLGFLREIIFAAYFGLQQNFEIYLVAAALPAAVNIVLLVLGQNYFIPNYFKFNREYRTDFLNHSLNAFFFTCIMVCLVLYFFSEEIISFYVNTASAKDQDDALIIFRLLVISIPLNSLISILYAFLQAEKNFTAPVISNLIVNIFIIFAVPFFTYKFGVFIIPLSYLSGIAAQAIYLLMIVRKKAKIRFSPFFFRERLKINLGSFFLFTFLIEIIGQLFTIVDRYFLDEVEKGGIAALNYSIILYQLPVVILPFAITTVLFPSFSESFRSKEINELKNKVDKSLGILIFLSIPAAFIFIFYGNFLIELLYKRGTFSGGDVEMTFEILKLYSISLVFYAVYSLINKLLYSTDLLKSLLFISLVGLILKIVLSYLLVSKLFQNGLALSTSIGYIFLCLAGLTAVNTLKLNTLKIFFSNLVYYSLNAFICLLISLQLVNLILIEGELGVILQIAAFLLLFMINCLILKDESLEIVLNSISQLLNRVESRAAG